MKKLFNLLVIFLFFCLKVSFSQSLFGWKHYYSGGWLGASAGNYIIGTGPEEILSIDKSTLGLSRIPYPPALRAVTPHNAQLNCGIDFSSGPGYSYILHDCNNYFSFDGSILTPTSSIYLGFDLSDIRFLTYEGSHVFFVSDANQKLYEYDGNNLTWYDSTNCPANPADLYSYVFTTASDNIIIVKDFEILIYHNNTWSSYDTTFFNQSYIYMTSWGMSPAGDFSFVNGLDSTLNTFNNATGTWQLLHLPSSIMHGSAYNFQVNSLYYDANNSLWLAGDSIFSRYDNSQFTDYFNDLTQSSMSLYSTSLISEVSIGRLMVMLYDKYFILDTLTHILTPFQGDTHDVLTGNQMLPSLKDNNGNLWFGACGWSQWNGLMKYDGSTWTTPDLDNHHIHGGVWSLCKDTGNTIVFGYGDLGSDGLVQVTDTNITLLNDSLNSIEKVIKDIAIDRNHHYWVGGFGAGVPMGLVEFYNGVVTYHQNFNSSEEVYSIELDSLENKWVSYDSFDGVYMFDGTNWTNYNTMNSPLPNDTIIDIRLQPNTNTIWFCTAGGFAGFNQGNWTVVNMSNSPLPDNHGENIYWGQDGGTWYSTQGGFAYNLNTSWEVYTVYNSPLDNSDVENIVMDDNCNVWFCTEAGLTTVKAPCAAPAGIIFNITVTQYDGTPAGNDLVYVYKLNSSGDDIVQVDNFFTDDYGHYKYYSTDTGSYAFMSLAHPMQFPGQLNAYQDSAKVIQESQLISGSIGSQNNVSIQLIHATPSPGQYFLKGKITSATERIGSVRLLLLLNNQPVASILTNQDGTFQFSNIAAGVYSVWVDKMGLLNNLAPNVPIDSMTSQLQFRFVLYPEKLVLNMDGISSLELDHDIQVYPNPVTNEATFIIPDVPAFLRIFDCIGKLVAEQNIVSNKTIVQLQNLHDGIYFYSLQNSSSRYSSGRFIKK